MSSYSLLLALSGFRYSAPDRWIEFSPRLNEQDFTTFFSSGTGWGKYRQRMTGAKGVAEIGVEYGSLVLTSIRLGLKKVRTISAMCGGHSVPATVKGTPKGVDISFVAPLKIEKGETLVLTCGLRKS